MSNVPLTAVAEQNPCSAHAYHQPEPIWTHRHHVIPLAWTEALGISESRTVLLCPHAHDRLHWALRKALKGERYSVGRGLWPLLDEAVKFASEQNEPRLLELTPHALQE